jgi:hypothetical protein
MAAGAMALDASASEFDHYYAAEVRVDVNAIETEAGPVMAGAEPYAAHATEERAGRVLGRRLKHVHMRKAFTLDVLHPAACQRRCS